MSKVKEQRERQQQLEQDTIAYSRLVEQLMEKYRLSVLNFHHVNGNSSAGVFIARIALENSSTEVTKGVVSSIYGELTKFLFPILGHTERLDIEDDVAYKYQGNYYGLLREPNTALYVPTMNAYCQRGVVESMFNEMVESKRKGAGSKVSELILYRDRKITSKTKDPVSGKVARHWFVSSAPNTPSREYLFDYLLDSDEER